MQRRLFCLFGFLLASLLSPSFAVELTNRAGKVYRDVSIISNKCDATSVTFSHKAGITKLRYDELSLDDREKYGLSSSKPFESASETMTKSLAGTASEAPAETTSETPKEKSLGQLLDEVNQLIGQADAPSKPAAVTTPVVATPVPVPSGKAKCPKCGGTGKLPIQVQAKCDHPGKVWNRINCPHPDGLITVAITRTKYASGTYDGKLALTPYHVADTTTKPCGCPQILCCPSCFRNNPMGYYMATSATQCSNCNGAGYVASK